MVANKRIGFAVVGLGAIARGSVLPAFARSKKAKLIAVVSRDKAEAANVARKFRITAHYSTDEFSHCLADPQIDAIYIATPPGAHETYTLQAAAAGKHVLCEKPLAANIEQSARMVEACRRHRVLLMTAYRKYFEPSSVYLKQLIRKSNLGRIDTIHAAFSELFVPGTSIPWLVDRTLAGGGPLMDLGVYCINTTRFLVDENPVEASAQSWTRNTQIFRDVEESISFRLRFPSGLVVLGSASYGAVISSSLFVQGAKGWASLTPAFDFNQERRLTGEIGKRWFEKKFPLSDEFAPELDAFAAAIQTNRTVACDGLEGHRDMLIVDAIYKSAKKGQPVAIDYQSASAVGA